MIARPRTNWAGNIAFGAPGFYRPSSLGEIRDRLGPVLRICEIRVIPADQLWLSSARTTRAPR